MKTISQINDSISDLIKDIKELESRNEFKAAKSKQTSLLFMRDMVRYLELNPSESFVRSEFERIDNLISHYNEQWAKFSLKYENLQSKRVTELKSKYFKDNNIDMALLNKQLKTLNYILS